MHMEFLPKISKNKFEEKVNYRYLFKKCESVINILCEAWDLGDTANLSRRNSKNKLVREQNNHQLVIEAKFL